MGDSCELLQDECVEILVKTDSEILPRGEDPRNFTSFEKLVLAAVGLETNALKEHNYAQFNNDHRFVRQDHSYSSGNRHRKTVSEEDLTSVNKSSSKDHSYFKSNMILDSTIAKSSNTRDATSPIPCLPLYRSNDSALDVIGFDSVSDKCLSTENIHMKTVEVYTEPQLFSGSSDPDISRMTINSEPETQTSSLPRFLANYLSKRKRFDHTYSHNLSCTNDASNNATDHTYNTRVKNPWQHDNSPKPCGVKRLRSSGQWDIKAAYSRRQDFKSSPFLDHSYRLLEKQKVARKPRSLKQRKGDKSENETDAVQQNINYRDSKDVLLDHTYGEVDDVDSPYNDQIKFRDVLGERRDHSYVKGGLMKVDSSSDLSDSGTESLNEAEEAEMSMTFERLLTCIAHSKDHNYVK